jgi:hypothetical protein
MAKDCFYIHGQGVFTFYVGNHIFTINHLDHESCETDHPPHNECLLLVLCDLSTRIRVHQVDCSMVYSKIFRFIQSRYNLESNLSLPLKLAFSASSA